jgi:hypothetical protein
MAGLVGALPQVAPRATIAREVLAPPTVSAPAPSLLVTSVAWPVLDWMDGGGRGIMNPVRAAVSGS